MSWKKLRPTYISDDILAKRLLSDTGKYEHCYSCRFSCQGANGDFFCHNNNVVIEFVEEDLDRIICDNWKSGTYRKQRPWDERGWEPK